MSTTPRIIGFYPIVDTYEWVEKLLPLGVRSIQLRIKDQPHEMVEAAIAQSVALAKQYDCQLFINDYWSLAIKYKAFGVHLGQEDLNDADVQAIHASGLRLGVSTHNDHEIDKALAANPFYLGYGPIYATTTKAMKATPRGIDRLVYWVNRLSVPIVAIGGISLQKLPDVMVAGSDGVAVVSAVTKANDYPAVVRTFMEKLDHSVIDA